MYLKRLEIQGFKSFANKTVLDFLAPKSGVNSITAIVGPNGSGKSNVTDAIRWVMGEQSMKHVRAKKSEDVIFNGSETKGAMSVAEVTMVMDNTASPHPTLSTAVERGRKTHSVATEGEGGGISLDTEEITLTRRLYRNGESEYLVNNAQARLYDIHLMLAKLKFAEGAYSIVSQGMIDRLLTVTNSERKDFFDEACGIKEYQIKEHQASLKLARTEENMKQAETLMAEVEPRLKILAKQVKKLEQRHEVETKLTEVQEKYYLTLYTKNKIEIETLKKQLASVDEKYHESFGALEIIQTELAGLAHAATRQEVFEQLQRKHQEAVRAKNELERQLMIIDGHMQTEYSQAGKQNVGWLENKLHELGASYSKLKDTFKTAEAEAQRHLMAANEQKKKVENMSLEYTQLKLKISRLQGQLMQNQSEQSYLQLSGLTAVKAILEARNQFGGKVYGLVAELGEVDEQYRLALEVAAGANLSSIVVENEQVARKAIEYLRENRFGVATFLPLNKIAGSNFAALQTSEPGVQGKALDLVRYDSKFENIFSMIFGTTLVVDTLHTAEKIGVGKARMVTLDGDVVEYKGIMRGGFRNRRAGLSFSSKLSLTNDDQLAEVQAEINLENHNLVELEKNIETARLKSVELQVLAQSATNKTLLVEEEYKNVERELKNVEHELSLVKASPEEYGERMKKLSVEKNDAALKQKDIEEAVQKIEAEIENFNKKEEEKKQRVFMLQEKMQKKQEEVNGVLAQRSELNIQLAKFETKREDLQQEVENDMKVSLQSIVDRLGVEGYPLLPEEGRGEEGMSLQSLVDTIQKLKYQLSLIGGIDEEVVSEYTKTKERFDFLDGQLSDLHTATTDLKEMIEELSEIMKKKRAQAFKKIRKDFDRYFKILFGGGSADLEEVYGEVEDSETSPVVLSSAEQRQSEPSPSQWRGQGEDSPDQNKKREKVLTGIDVIANPPGKKVKYLNMLSGGERTLTSIALICAILFNNPSPFVVLDEVEAALDEANTLRFARIMAELSTHSQFIIVTHNRVTMHAAHAIYGVTMGGDGVSKLLSVKMEELAGVDNN